MSCFCCVCTGPTSGGNRGRGGSRRKTFGKYGSGRGHGYIQEIMETRNKVENMEYMDESLSDCGDNRSNKGRKREKPPPGLRGKELG